MSTIDVFTPDGTRHRHADSAQTGRVEVRPLEGGGFEVIGVRETKEVRAWGGQVVRPASRSEDVLAAYPEGSRIDYLTR